MFAISYQMIIFIFVLKEKNRLLILFPKTITHNVSKTHFILWVYFNNDEKVNIDAELRLITDIAKEHDIRDGINYRVLLFIKHLPMEFLIFPLLLFLVQSKC